MSISTAIDLAGGVGALASLVGVQYQAIQRYRKTGIPARRVLAVCAAVNWAITPHEVDPDLYPNPTDGLPSGLRRRARAA